MSLLCARGRPMYSLSLSLARSLPVSRACSLALSLSDTQTLTHTQKVWITDSCPMQAELVNGKGPFEVLSLAPLIASHIDLAPVEVGGGVWRHEACHGSEALTLAGFRDRMCCHVVML